MILDQFSLNMALRFENDSPLNFRGDFYFGIEEGFIVASENGNIAFLDLSGHYLGEIQLPEPIIAIAPFTKDKLAVIIEKSGKRIRQFYQLK